MYDNIDREANFTIYDEQFYFLLKDRILSSYEYIFSLKHVLYLNKQVIAKNVDDTAKFSRKRFSTSKKSFR
jgi:hypothetical protein